MRSDPQPRADVDEECASEALTTRAVTTTELSGDSQGGGDSGHRDPQVVGAPPWPAGAPDAVPGISNAARVSRPRIGPVRRSRRPCGLGPSLTRSRRAAPAPSRRASSRRRRPAARRPRSRVNPGNLDDLDVLVAELAAHRLEQVVVHRLVDPPVLGDEPEVDGAERGDDPTADAGLLLDLAHGGLFGGLALLDVALGEGPDEPPPAVVAGDERRARLARVRRSTTRPPAEVSSTVRSLGARTRPRARCRCWLSRAPTCQPG